MKYRVNDGQVGVVCFTCPEGHSLELVYSKPQVRSQREHTAFCPECGEVFSLSEEDSEALRRWSETDTLSFS